MRLLDNLSVNLVVISVVVGFQSNLCFPVSVQVSCIKIG